MAGLDITEGARARRARTAILNGRGHKLVWVVVSGRADRGIESEQLFPLDAIFQFEHLNNRGGLYCWLLLPSKTESHSSENGKKRKEKRDTLAGKGKTEKIREDLSLDRLSKSETASLRPYFFPV